MNNPADTLAALAPCPFCGGDARVIESRLAAWSKPTFAVGCEPCNMVFCENTQAESIAAWNRRASLKGEAAKPKFTTGHCENHRKPGGCHLHNLQCGYPECDRRPVEPTPSPAPQRGGEWFAMESLPVNAPKQHPERNAAEQAYTQTAFNYEANPIGCRDWTIYWRGWWHRAVINDLTTPPAQQPGEVGEDIAELRRNYDGAKRWLFALAMEQGGSVSVSRQTLYRMRPDDRLTMMESPSGDAYRLTAALAPKENK